ncbi:condensin complex subunit 3 [Hyalella azteca]|uniref:Condensin complex subunit 3 n=1 Tax=Hyalella azteca TaxID=294128 RepID=A0A8B7PD89_HYAAZ|nr:condensin complex subunit 3 [Hyalella azteca]
MTAKSAKVAGPAPTTVKNKLGQNSLQKVFEAAQKTLAVHSKLCVHLTKIYHKTNFDIFFSEFVDLLKVCLVVGEKHPQVERCLSFVATFTTYDKTLKEDKSNEKSNHNNEKDLGKTPEELDKEKELSSSSSQDSTVVQQQEEEEVDNDVDEFLIKMFQFLLNIHEAQSSAVRYRVCQLINRILNSMGKSASLDDDLFNTIYDTMLERLMDRKPAVRVQAIHALNRLQDPTNKDCPVIKAYRYHLSMDPASEVRRAALCCTALNFQTLPDVLQRTRDKNNLVRRQAYIVLAQKVHIKSLQISQRVRLLSEGLNDRSDVVRVAVQKNLLNSWLRFVNSSVLDLLTCLDVEAFTKEAEMALDAVFMDVPAATLVQGFDLLDDDKLLPLDKLKPESALYWKNLAKHLKKEEADEELDFILPDLSVFCRYTEAYALSPEAEVADEHAAAVQLLERQFVLQQLVHITAYYDLADEVGRRSLVQMVRRLLVCPNLGEASIAVLVEAFGRLYPPASRVQQLAEIISDFREPVSEEIEEGNSASKTATEEQLEIVPQPTAMSEDEMRAKKIQAAKVRVQLNELREALEECVRSLDLDRAQELKLKLKDLQSEHEALQQQLITPQQTPKVKEKEKTDSSPVETVDANQQTTQAQTQQQTQQQEEDPVMLSHCLTIVCEMLRNPDINVLSPTLHSLHDNLLLPCLKNQDALVREMSVRALALLCIISQDLACKHLPLFIQISQVDTEAIQVAAVQAVFDLLLLHGLENLKGKQEDQSSVLEDADAIVSVLSERLEQDDGKVRNAVALGLCKLLNFSRLQCPKLLSQLTLLWYNPLTEEDTQLRQMLGSFFPVYASKGGLHQECVSASILRTLRTLSEASPRSPYHEVDLDDVCSFLLSITSPAIVSKDVQQTNVHDALVFTLCGEMLAHPNSSLTHHLCRSLRLLSLTPDNYTNLSQLHTLLAKLMKRVRGDRTLMTPLEKFMLSVTELLKRAPAQQGSETPAPADESKRLSAADESSSLCSKSIDGTFARRKRQLYSTESRADLLSSEVESEVGDAASPEEKASSSVDSRTDPENTVKNEEDAATESDTLAVSNQEIQLSGEWDDKETTVTEKQSSPAAHNNTAVDSEAVTSGSTSNAAAPVSHPEKNEELATDGSEIVQDARPPTRRATRHSSTASEDSATKRVSAACRRSRRAAVRYSLADTSTDEEIATTSEPAVSSKRSATQKSADNRKARITSTHQSEESNSAQSSGSSSSPVRPAVKRLRRTKNLPSSSASPASSSISTRSSRSSNASTDASNRRSQRSTNESSQASSGRSTRSTRLR